MDEKPAAFSQLETKRIRLAVADYDMPTSEHWCGVMKRARKARGLTQEDIADAVGTNQGTISDIENGHVASKFVPAVCLALKIPLPMIFTKDEFDERWVEVGRVLRARSMRRFQNYLANFEEEAGIEPPVDDQPDELESADVETGARVATGRPGKPDQSR